MQPPVENTTSNQISTMTPEMKEFIRFGEVSTKKEGKYAVNSGYTNILILFVMLFVGIWVFILLLKTTTGIDLLDTKNQRNKLILGGIGAVSILWIMNVVVEGNIGKLGQKIERGDSYETAGLKRVAQRWAR